MTADIAAVGMQALRQIDPDRYLSTLYAPEDKREALATLHVFNAEIAAIRNRIHEPLPGEIRIQWWRDTLASGDGDGAGHPLAEALLTTIATHHLPKDAFDRYLEARIFDLYDDPMPSRTDLEGYCGDTASGMIQLAAMILDAASAPAYAAAAGHAGCALGISGIVRLLPLHRRRGQCFIPQEILAAAGTDRDRFIESEDDEASRRAVEGLIALGREHMAQFIQNAVAMPATLRPAFLPVALAPHYFDRASRRGFDPLLHVTEISALRRYWAMFRTASTGWR